jgi:hypothetical protein
MIKENDDE